MAQDNYHILIGKLDAFIRKYYKNQLIRGSLYTFTALLGAWLVFSSLEYFGHFSTWVRAVLFWGFVCLALISLWNLIIRPMMGLFRAGRIISHEQAAEIIGTHFQHVQDKLLNTLQLKAESDRQGAANALLLAGIDQKINELKPVPFTAAIDFGKNRKYIRYAAIPTLVLVVILFAAPSLIFDGSKRLVRNQTHFEIPAPFQFEIMNDSLTAIEGDDYTLDLQINGQVMPSSVYVNIDGNQFRLDRENKSRFKYTFRNIRKSSRFHFLADGYSSSEYQLKAIPNPSVLSFNVSLTYPDYTGKSPELLSNTGDLSIPAGTRVKWEINARNTRELKMGFHDTLIRLTPAGSLFTHARAYTQSESYSITPANEFMETREPMHYQVQVIPDLYPSIQVEKQQDSISSQLIYFKGLIRDDYGFSKLSFNYRFLKASKENARSEKINVYPLQIKRNTTQDQFFHSWNMQTLMIEPGEEIEYYFEVWDNDGVRGAKSSRSQSMIFKAPTLQELAKDAETRAEKTKADLEKSIELARKLQKDLESATRDLVEKKNLNYDERRKIEELLRQHRELENQVNNIRNENKQNTARENEYRRNSEQLMEKKSQLEQLFEKLMSEEMRKMMQELEKMLAELNKDQLKEMVEKMKLSNEDLEKQLDRTLELFKQLEVEQKIKQAIEQLEQLAEDQQKLADKTENTDKISEELKAEQNQLSKEFNELKNELKSIQDQNKELEFPQELGSYDQETQEISDELQQSEEQMSGDKKQQKKASQSQKNAGQKMEQLAQKMKKEQEQADMDQAQEDLQALRALLENLIRFSLNQESLMESLKGIDVNNPKFTKLAQRQRELKDDARVLEDSLFALSKRVVQISSVVNTEIAKINYHIGKSIGFLQDRFVPQARSDQQYVMTSVNNLALMLTEAFDQMQQQMQSQQQMQGNGSCKKPGQGKPSPSAQRMRQLQQQLNDQMKALKKKMEGQKPGDGKKGQRGDGMSEELARMAAQQEAIRNELQQLNMMENKDGQGTLGNLEQMAKQMEETEKDLVNRRLSAETIKRQEDILTRLLESEKAEREREQDEKRQSKEGREDLFRNNARFEEYKKLKMKEVELLKTIPPNLNVFYKNLVNYYFQALEN
jgi:hypothetical protein